jgi:hypothetical protein
MALPDTCGECIYWQRAGELCRRHAPSPSHQDREVSYGPATAVSDRCGVGSDTEGEDGQLVRCVQGIHWHQPQDRLVLIAERRGMTPEWWVASGYCTRYAPPPTGTRGWNQTHWRVTHETDGCGDGEAIDADQLI